MKRACGGMPRRLGGHRPPTLCGPSMKVGHHPLCPHHMHPHTHAMRPPSTHLVRVLDEDGIVLLLGHLQDKQVGSRGCGWARWK